MQYTLKVRESDCNSKHIFSVEIKADNEKEAVDKAKAIAGERYFQLEIK